MELYLLLKKYTPTLIKRLFGLWVEDREKELTSSKNFEEVMAAKRKAKAITKNIYQSGDLPTHLDEAIEDFKKKLPYDDEDLLELIRIKKNYLQKKPAAKKKPATKKVPPKK
jgi:hypothetical protein